MSFGNDDSSIGLRADGAHVVVRGMLQEFLGGEAARLVLAANEEELFVREERHYADASINRTCESGRARDRLPSLTIWLG
jgi:hypothetical protein